TFNNTATIRASALNSTYSGTINVGTGGSVILSSGAGLNLTIGDGANDYHAGSGTTTNIVGNASAGAVILPFSNDYQGAWSVNTGTLRLGNATALGSGTSAVNVGNGALELSGITLARDVTLGNTATLRGTGAAVASGAVTLASGVTGTSDVFTLGGGSNHLTGGGGTSSITVNSFGNSKVVLTQSSNYVGSWNIPGRLQIDNDAELGDAANPVNISGGVFVVTGTTTSSRLFTCNDGFF